VGVLSARQSSRQTGGGINRKNPGDGFQAYESEKMIIRCSALVIDPLRPLQRGRKDLKQKNSKKIDTRTSAFREPQRSTKGLGNFKLRVTGAGELDRSERSSLSQGKQPKGHREESKSEGGVKRERVGVRQKGKIEKERWLGRGNRTRRTGRRRSKIRGREIGRNEILRKNTGQGAFIIE